MIADLCLVLLLDSSGSVDAAEWELQAKATAEAISSPAIVERILSGPHGRIAVTALEWSGAAITIVPWTEIATPGQAQSFATALATYQRRMSGSTAVGDALLAAGEALGAPAPQGQGMVCVRQVVDISADGTNNAGSDPRAAVDLLQVDGVEVNAIVIPDEIGVVAYYEKTVPGFVLTAHWPAYAEAIKAKLALEIAAYPAGSGVRPPLDRAWGGGGVAYRPWDMGWGFVAEGPLPFFPDLRFSDSVLAPGAAWLLAAGLFGLLLARTRAKGARPR